MKQGAALLLSMDVEDWAQSTWDRSLPISDRAADNTQRVLDVLGKHGVQITMFVLGKFAERFPALVRRMRDEGHEIASHGYGHVEVFRQTPSEFESDVLHSVRLLEDICGVQVVGYRAPDFSIVANNLWALQVLASLGLKYDSSIFPIAHNRYGIASWPTGPVRVALADQQSLVELPIATTTIYRKRLPVAGGGYHRLLPLSAIDWAVRRTLGDGRPFVAYCHPYEFDPHEFSALSVRIPLKTRLHQGLGRGGFQRKFENLLTSFRIQRYKEAASGVTAQYRATAQPQMGRMRCS